MVLLRGGNIPPLRYGISCLQGPESMTEATQLPVQQRTIHRLKEIFPSEVVEEALKNRTLVLTDEKKDGQHERNNTKTR